MLSEHIEATKTDQRAHASETDGLKLMVLHPAMGELVTNAGCQHNPRESCGACRGHGGTKIHQNTDAGHHPQVHEAVASVLAGKTAGFRANAPAGPG